MASKHPTLSFKYFYVTKGDTAAIHHNVAARIQELQEAIQKHFNDAGFSFSFIGAAELLNLARKRPPQTLSLPFAELLSASVGGYVALTKIADYNAFMRDSDGLRHGHIFDENVRAYQGNVDVNKAIKDTLDNPTEDDFWQLNNGITILTPEASTVGKTINISDPQIINGLQTSTEILSYYDGTPQENDPRHILIKVVKTESPATRDRVIKATNSQTGVQAASLRATDQIQRDIEEAIVKAGLFYDRQKNYYKNEGKPRGRIIGISEMAQSVMSMLLQKPNDARARPSNLIKDDKDYATLFNSDYGFDLYCVVGEAKKAVDDWLKSAGFSSADRNNLVFHILTRLAVTLTQNVSPSAADISSIDPKAFGDEAIKKAYEEVNAIYVSLGGDATVAKGKPFVDAVLAIAP